MDTELTVIEDLVCEDWYIKIERDGHKFNKITIDLSEIEKMRQQLTTLQAEKERLEGELGRLRHVPINIAVAVEYLVGALSGEHEEIRSKVTVIKKFLASLEHPTQEPTNDPV